MNKIRKIDSSKTAPSDARATWGPFTAGFEWDGNTGVNTAVGHIHEDKPGDLVALATRYKASYVEQFDDFLGDTLRTDVWAVFSGSDSQAADPVTAATAGVNGELSMVTGDDGTTTVAVNGTQINGDGATMFQSAPNTAPNIITLLDLESKHHHVLFSLR